MRTCTKYLMFFKRVHAHCAIAENAVKWKRNLISYFVIYQCTNVYNKPSCEKKCNALNLINAHSTTRNQIKRNAASTNKQADRFIINSVHYIEVILKHHEPLGCGYLESYFQL